MRFELSLGFVLAAVTTFVQGLPLTRPEIDAKAAEGFRLLSIEDGAEPVWKTSDEKLDLLRNKIHFFDVTEVYEPALGVPSSSALKAPAVTFPAPSHQTAVKAITATLSTTNMASYLSTLTAFNNRYYTSSTGKSASDSILSTLKSIIASRSDITVAAFAHSWVQSSIILKFAGTSTTAPITILGAHFDSINLNSPSSGRAPGADDDGSGTVNLIEIVRALVAASYKPATPLEFHWYSGEEAGLLGSQAIAKNYKSAGKSVKAFMELDMTGYFKPGTTEVIALEADYIDSGLNSFVKLLVGQYSKLPVVMDTPCGYACSDHASWNAQGYPTSMQYEAVTGNDNQLIHSASDTTSVSGFSWAHSIEFAKVAVGFAVELTSA